jgi:hypothetical protein
MLMKLLTAVTGLALLFGTAALWPDTARTQEINFDQIDKFESLGTGTLHRPVGVVGAFYDYCGGACRHHWFIGGNPLRHPRRLGRRG